MRRGCLARSSAAPSPSRSAAPGRQVLQEHVGFRQQPVEHVPRRVLLDVEREALLGAIGPDEVRRQAFHRPVVAARGVAAARALDLDHARTELGELARGKRPGNHLLERDHGNALERPHRKEIFRPARGSPLISVCHSSPGRDRMRIGQDAGSDDLAGRQPRRVRLPLYQVHDVSER